MCGLIPALWRERRFGTREALTRLSLPGLSSGVRDQIADLGRKRGTKSPNLPILGRKKRSGIPNPAILPVAQAARVPSPAILPEARTLKVPNPAILSAGSHREGAKPAISTFGPAPRQVCGKCDGWPLVEKVLEVVAPTPIMLLCVCVPSDGYTRARGKTASQRRASICAGRQSPRHYRRGGSGVRRGARAETPKERGERVPLVAVTGRRARKPEVKKGCYCGNQTVQADEPRPTFPDGLRLLGDHHVQAGEVSSGPEAEEGRSQLLWPHHHPSPGRRHTSASYRIIDFKRNKDGVPAKVATIEYDPNRTGPHRPSALRGWREALHHSLRKA